MDARVPYYRPATHAPQTGQSKTVAHRQASDLAHPESDHLHPTPSLPSGDPFHRSSRLRARRSGSEEAGHCG